MQSNTDAPWAGIDAPDCADGQMPGVIEGADYARAYLDRLHAGVASPEDLAVLMAFLHGEMLAGACGVIEKALRGGRHG